MKTFPSILLVIGLLFIGCSDNPSDGHSEYITAEINDGTLHILNISQQTIYVFAVDQEMAMSILWAPVSREENAIKPFATKKIPLSKKARFKPDNKIIVFYWLSKNPDTEDIKSILVGRDD